MKGKERIVYYDVIRAIACLMVVSIHAPLSTPEAYGPFLVANGYFCSPCVPLFFMISGALILSSPIELSLLQYYKKRLPRVVFPTLFFVVFYALLRFIFTPTSICGLIKNIISLPLTYTHTSPMLWFMYVLIGLYLITPILSPWIIKASKTDLQFFLCLWLISQLYPWLKLLLPVDQSTNGILYYFSGYVGYFILGYYLKNYDLSLKVLVPISLLLCPLPLIPKLFGIDINNGDLFLSYLTLPPTIFSITMFMIVKKYTQKLPHYIINILVCISQLSFGIYLIHPIVRYYILPFLPISAITNNFYIQYFISFFTCVIFSAVITYFVAEFRFGKYIVGYTTRK